MFTSIPKLLCLVLVLVLDTNGLVLRAYISQHGLHGEVQFSIKNLTSITIRTSLKPTLQYPDGVWRWSIHEYPVDYRDLSQGRCSQENLGREILDLTEELGYLVVPGKDHAEFESSASLTGKNGLWGRSLLLETAERDRTICASLFATDMQHEMQAVAKFTAPVAGTLNFRWVTANGFDDAYIHADLYHVKATTKQEFTQHKWKLVMSDISDSDMEQGNHEANCDELNDIFDPQDSRLGLIKVATHANVKKTKKMYKNKVLSTLRSVIEKRRRNLYVAVYSTRGESFLACAKLRVTQPKNALAVINMDGIKGTVNITQRSPFDPTWVDFSLASADKDYESNLRFVGSILQYSIRELPAKLLDAGHWATMCNTTGGVFNPTNIVLADVPPPGMSTQDQYPVGDLLGKYKGRTEYLNHRYILPGLANELSGAYWDVFLPLSGGNSVMHRSVVLTRRAPKHEICGTIHSYDFTTGYKTRMTSAQVVFRYPIVGRVVFRQPEDRPWEDTTIIVESMVHADGSNVNNTHEHRWALHANPPGADYYNWTARCLSAGAMLEPHGVHTDTQHPEYYCHPGLEGLCRLGDFTTRHGMLSVAGKKLFSDLLTRRLFTDTQAALTGRFSIMQRSLVIYDDHAPVARGERMACSTVNGLPRRKAVVQDWFGNGEEVGLTGKLELTQESEYDIVNAFVALEGIDEQIENYKIHVTPIERELEFPCEKTTIYDTYNPFNVSKAASPPPTKGTADQYELGDLGGKHGYIQDQLGGLMGAYRTFETTFNDTQLTLFGPYSILGRSVAIHKKIPDRPWACARVERGYSPSEAREIRGIASFHHPAGFAYGYVRLTQLVHADGSASDTAIEVKLRHPGVYDRNLTHNHNWEIFGNPVGVDVKVTNTHCVAGGYRWNPYFTQLADPLNRDLYSQECGVDNPLRCDVGDLTARLGTISVGGERQVFMDSNFPLEGNVSAMGLSLVVFGPDRSSERIACANIMPDKDIVKYGNIIKPPRFVLGQFLSEVRAIMGVPEWMVGVDARRTSVLHGGACVQIKLHFTGPDANKLELDFTKLLASGRLDAPSIFIPGFVNQKRKRTTSYRPCEVTELNDKKKPFTKTAVTKSPSLILLLVPLILLNLY